MKKIISALPKVKMSASFSVRPATTEKVMEGVRKPIADLHAIIEEREATITKNAVRIDELRAQIEALGAANRRHNAEIGKARHTITNLERLYA
ncbi:hypothetical protein [Rhizobium phage RHph_X3_9]|nr:hypothetical protein [Rhizobium phage RHph_X3_9]